MGVCRLLRWVGVCLSGEWGSKLRTFSRPMLLTINELQRFTLTWFCRRFVPNNILIIRPYLESFQIVMILPWLCLCYLFLPYLVTPFCPMLLRFCYLFATTLTQFCRTALVVNNLYTFVVIWCTYYLMPILPGCTPDHHHRNTPLPPPRYTTTTAHHYRTSFAPTLVSNVCHVNT